MVPLVGDPSSLLIRWIHVVGMALLVGGAVLIWGFFRAVHRDASVGLRAAAVYEWLFWGGAGLLVVTGVGNLGALAPFVPGPSTAWGLAFSVKVTAVLGLLVGSVPRTLSVVGGLSGSPPVSLAMVRRLRAGYAATAIYLLAVVALAEVLAHG